MVCPQELSGTQGQQARSLGHIHMMSMQANSPICQIHSRPNLSMLHCSRVLSQQVIEWASIRVYQSSKSQEGLDHALLKLAHCCLCKDVGIVLGMAWREGSTQQSGCQKKHSHTSSQITCTGKGRASSRITVVSLGRVGPLSGKVLDPPHVLNVGVLRTRCAIRL